MKLSVSKVIDLAATDTHRPLNHSYGRLPIWLLHNPFVCHGLAATVVREMFVCRGTFIVDRIIIFNLKHVFQHASKQEKQKTKIAMTFPLEL